MKKTLLRNIYKYDDKNKEFIIDIALDSYQELFNDWDASPTWKKDLDPDLAKYLETSSYDIPRKNSLRINFVLPHEYEIKKSEERVLRGINNHFKSELYFTRVELRYIFRKIRRLKCKIGKKYALREKIRYYRIFSRRLFDYQKS